MNTDSSMGKLIALGGNLENPREAKASDWASVGPTGAAGSSSGAGKLVTQTQNQEGPRHTEDDGENTASKWGKVEGFTVSVSKGESGTAPGSVSIKGSVDLSTGQMSPEACYQTY
jgi:hypothetical protein